MKYIRRFLSFFLDWFILLCASLGSVAAFGFLSFFSLILSPFYPNSFRMHFLRLRKILFFIYQVSPFQWIYLKLSYFTKRSIARFLSRLIFRK